MSAPARFIDAAVQDLLRRLTAPPPEDGRPRVAEAITTLPGEEAPEAPGLPGLAGLARQVVEAVLELAAQPLGPKALEQALEQAASEYLEGLDQRQRAVWGRLAAEVPRLLNLPALAELAGQGLNLPPLAAQTEPGEELVGGRSPAFAKVLKDLELVAATGFPVMLLGETGTGKELVARRLHRLSPRREGPLVAVNCAALAPGLLESELFGHVRGAFTGAAAPASGHVRAAQGGTLFLDEIGETTPEFQVRLLRVLEDGVVVPVGASQGQRVDFRLLTASSRDLEEAAGSGRFNQALLYRILVVPIRLPPLRQRREDLPLLLDHFLGQACLLARRTRRLSPGLRQWLLEYDWPGNARQMRHLMQRLVALSPAYEIGLDSLPPELNTPAEGRVDYYLRRLEGLEGLPRRRERDLAQALAAAAGGELANRDLRHRLGCSDSTVKNLFKVLTQAGLVEVIGERGGRRYLVRPPEEE
ncbi:MAG: sigma-54-dependent Fis family transcriptional regulator [Desulfarculus sp.]|nr:sigma-54-dependent Fis family transcriptional regulator [Desulfarculus sp.]